MFVQLFDCNKWSEDAISRKVGYSSFHRSEALALFRVNLIC